MKFHGEFLPFLLSVLTQQALAAPSQVTLVKVTMETTEDIASNYCRRDLAYCGWNLIKRDSDYKDRIHRALCKRGICNPNDPAIWNSLWNCGQDLEFMSICGGENSCRDGGSGHSDYCK